MEYRIPCIVKLRTLLLQSKWFYILFCIIIIFSLLITNKSYDSIYDTKITSFVLEINKYKIDGNKLSLELFGKENLIGNYYFKEEKEKKAFLNNYSIGDKISINGELKLPHNNTIPNTFNYKKYLKNKKIYYTLKIKDFKLHSKTKNLFMKIKNIFYQKINKIEKNEYLYAFILGEKSYIDSEVFDSYRNNGITHLFALSGLHVSVFSSMIFFILKIFKINDLTKYIIVFVVLLMLSFITGFPPSILRASLLFLLIGLNKIYYFYIKSSDLLLLCGSILILINPYLIYDLSFKLSFTITYFILLNINDFSKNYIKGLLEVSFISFLASLPIIINNFYSFNILSIINNLFFVPFVSFIVYPLSLITFILPYFELFLEIFIKIMEFVSYYLSKVDFLIISFSKINLISIIIYYILLIIIIIKKDKKCLILLLIIVVLNYIIPFIDKNTYIYFTDVDQGDSILIRTRNNKSVLIDTGGVLKYYKNEVWSERNNNFSLMESSLIPFYKSIGIKSIDYLLITHGDEDHAGYSIDLIKNFNVKNVVFNYGEYNELEKTIIKVLKTKNINHYKNLEELNIDNIKLHFLNTKEYDNENDNSTVIYTEINNVKILLMGDSGVEREKDIINQYTISNIDILKVGHHGSNTSSNKNFINTINPKISVISVGENNKFGHPKESVLENLQKSKIYRTDKNGTIQFKITNNSLYINTYQP